MSPPNPLSRRAAAGVAAGTLVTGVAAGHATASDATAGDAGPVDQTAGTVPYRRLSADTAAALFVDHQTGLMSLVRDYETSEFRNAVLAYADLAKFFGIPAILTTSFEDGPNGPIMPEIREMHPEAPFIARPGQISAWDNEEFVKAIEATGREQLIIAGIVTEVCVAFPALAAREAGYEVFVCTDASGTFNEPARQSAWMRMQQAGCQLLDWFAVASELQRDWRRDVKGFGDLLVRRTPAYAAVMASYKETQE